MCSSDLAIVEAEEAERTEITYTDPAGNTFESIDFHNRVRQEYLQLSSLDPERYLVIDAQRSIEDIHQEITNRITKLSK